MLEYIFFSERTWRSFIEFLEGQKLTPKAWKGKAGWLVALPEDLDDSLNERVEAYYDEIVDHDAAQVAQTEGSALCKAGVCFTLSDGRLLQANIDPELMRLLSGAVTHEELEEFVNAVVDAVERGSEQSS
jgi:hypothetical protein